MRSSLAAARAAVIERVLGVSLDAAESGTSLHVALLAVESSADPPPDSAGC